MAGWIRIIFGVFFLFVSFGLIIMGGALLIVPSIFADDAGYLNSPTDTVDLPDAEAIALFAESVNIDNDYVEFFVFNTGGMFSLRLKIDNLNTSLSGFDIYYGPTEGSRSYLADVTYYEITDVDMDISWREGTMNLEFTKHEATTGATAPPDWYDEVSGGSELVIDRFTSAGFAVIIMNPGGETGINALMQFGVTLPILDVIGVGLIIFGGLFLAVSFLLIIWGATAKPKRPDTPLQRVRYYSARESAVKEEAGKKILVCSTCGTKNSGDSKYCFECGEPLFSSKEPEIGVRKAEPVVGITSDMVIADGGARFWAWVIDMVIINMVIEAIKWPFYLFGFFDFVFFGISFFSLNSFALFLYWTATETFYGQSIGKAVLGIEVVTESGEKPELVPIVVSSVGKAFFLPFDVIISWFVKDQQKISHFGVDFEQRLSQSLVKTVVIRKRYKLPEPDEKPEFVSGKY
ncbi:MAG: RDD family protein [Candidatus Hodarchaeales archaeon]|jgi:uncharacterized RDD family membrane protein YckC